MYKEAKRIIKLFFPKRVLFKYEPKFRIVLYQFYKGENVQCNVCNNKLRKFITIENNDKLCPNCGSIARTRRLWNILNTEYLKKGITMLDFSPSRCLYRILKRTPGIKYSSTDLSGDFLSDFQYDITNIDAKNERYDLILCYHVLEHIENDIQAMKELYRVLKKGGTCIIQTPFKKGAIYEDSSIKSNHDRLKHFGQEDHVRIYSVSGLKDRLIQAGFQVTIKQFTELENNKVGFKTQEDVLVCSK